MAEFTYASPYDHSKSFIISSANFCTSQETEVKFVSGIIAMSVLITGGIVTGAESVNETVKYTVQDIKSLQDFLVNKPT